MKLRDFARVALLALVATAIEAGCRSAPRANVPEPFFFIQMSDPQFGMFTANKDFAQETVNFERAIAAANRLHPAFVVITGDLTNAQGDAAQIAEYHRISRKLDPGIPLYSIPGNHDVGLPLSSESVRAYRQAYGRDYYTFENHGVFGIVINSTLFKEPALAPAEAAAQEDWLRSTLASARGAGHQRIMVFQHHSWFLTDASEPDQYFNLPSVKRREMLELMKSAGVSHVFAGHYHRTAFGRDGPLEMVTTGPVGKPLGADSSGIRIVVVDGGTVTHRYVALDSIPVRVLPR
ncbi:MAG: metallophosphoesterase [Gemmatimonadota bacterium]